MQSESLYSHDNCVRVLSNWHYHHYYLYEWQKESYNERCWVNYVWQNFTIRIFAWTFKLSVDNDNALSFTHTNIMCQYLDLISKLEQSEPFSSSCLKRKFVSQLDKITCMTYSVTVCGGKIVVMVSKLMTKTPPQLYSQTVSVRSFKLCADIIFFLLQLTCSYLFWCPWTIFSICVLGVIWRKSIICI